ncbi:HPr family phosphocarrier protein [Paenibacillus illinoisensis]|uniref:HPr family phosphocarrier protein n=1 Tax=Paenibacillus illinoisensis TaxID=59845 RepID=UPI003CF9AD37
MLKKNFKMTITTGFARPATLLVTAGRMYRSNISIEFEGSIACLKQDPITSFREIMSLDINPGAEIIVRIDGQDECEAIQCIEEQFLIRKLRESDR